MKNYADINWEKCEKEVLKLQRKIIAAYRKGETRKVYELQERLVRKAEARALAVRKVTTNKGKNTPGVDGTLIRTNVEKLETIKKLLGLKNYKAQPVRRIYIKKANGTLRPLGIPSMYDRCVQALYALALDPIAEEKADNRSYGYRKYRSTNDVQQYTRAAINQKDAARYIFEGDIKGFYENINKDWIMKNIPMNKYILKEWLNAGYLENFSQKNLSRINKGMKEEKKGIPQGSIISPIIANMVLDGMESKIMEAEKLIKSEYIRTTRGIDGKRLRNYNTKIHYVRYADNFLITADKEQFIEKLLPVIKTFLKERGLVLNEKKCRITEVTKGFDFVGFNFRKYTTTKRSSNEILLATPTKKNILNLRLKIRRAFKKYKSFIPLVSELNPILRGWANYYCCVNSTRVFYSMDYYVISKLISWIRSLKRNRGMKAAVKEYFTPLGGNRWKSSYTDPKTGKTFRLFSLGEVKISQHILVRDLNPYDLENEKYYKDRREKEWMRTIPEFYIKLIKKTKGSCMVCKKALAFNEEEDLEVHHIQPREFKGNQKIKNLLLLHKTCHQSVTNCKDPELLAKYVSEGIIKPLSERYKKLLDKSIKASNKKT